MCVIDVGSGRLRGGLFACGAGGTQLEVLGATSVETEGLRRGCVSDLAALSESVRALVDKLELTVDARISRAVLVIGNRSLRLTQTTGVAGVAGHVVQPKDIRRAEEAARERFSDLRHRLVHEAVIEYRLDGRSSREQPNAMQGQRLEVDVQHLSMSATQLTNVVRAVQRAGLQVEAVCSAQQAQAEAALTEAQRVAGVALFDLGAETGTASVYVDGDRVAAACTEGGGWDLTRAMSQSLLIPLKNAETIKCAHAYVGEAHMGDRELTVQTIGLRDDRQLQQGLLREAIEPATEALLARLAQLVADSGCAEKLSAGLVLSGGVAEMEGLAGFAEQMLSVPVTVAEPLGLLGLVEMIRGPGHCGLAGGAKLWAKNALYSWERPSKRARQRNSVTPRWLDLYL